MPILRARLAVLMLAAGGLSLQSVSAAPPWKTQGRLGIQSGFIPQAREADRQMSPQEAARRAQAGNGGGRVLSVEPAGGGYRVKLLKDGEVRVVFIQG